MIPFQNLLLIGVYKQNILWISFKTLNALIGLQENIITPELSFCNEGHYYAKGAFMKCHCKKEPIITY